MPVNTVTLVDAQGRIISSTDNGDGTATLATSGGGGGGGPSTSVKILDTGGTNTATVSAGGAVKVDGSAATQPVSAAALPLPTGAATAAKQPALGTAGTAAADVLTVQGIASGTAQPVSAASLPLPAGAATAAKQPAIGVAGTASTDVLSVQGVASMTALKVDGSAVTQPVSNVSLPLPAGASTSAKQPALGTAGSASADVLSVQGVASMTALKVDGSAVTQPVSGTVTATVASPVATAVLVGFTVSAVIAASAKDYRGFTVRETAGSTAVIVVYDNASAASGTILEEIALAANESAREFYGQGGVKTTNGIYLSVVSGTVAGSVRTGP